MVSAHKEYLYQDEFDAVLDITESDFLEYGNEFQQDMNLPVEKILALNNHILSMLLLHQRLLYKRWTSQAYQHKISLRNS